MRCAAASVVLGREPLSMPFYTAPLLPLLLLQAAAAVQITKKEEQELLERIRQEFGAKHVVRVCSMFECEKVLEGARRLLEHAPAIKESVDLRGASLAIDDCYEVWGSGFISIPYDFTLQELQPQLVKLLQSSSTAASNGHSPGVHTSPQMRPMAAARGVMISTAGSSHGGLCSSYALQGQQHAGWVLSGVPRVAPQQQQRQQQRPRAQLKACALSNGQLHSSGSSRMRAALTLTSPSLSARAGRVSAGCMTGRL